MLELADFKPLEIDDGSYTEQKIHAENPLNGKAIVHGADLDLEPAHFHLAESHAVEPLREDELGAAYARNLPQPILRLGTDTELQQLVGGEHLKRPNLYRGGPDRARESCHLVPEKR